MNKMMNLRRGDRFITLSGQFGQSVQDYFAAKVSRIGEGMLIYAVSANMSDYAAAAERELEVPSYSSGYTEIVLDATGRWTVTWPGKKDGPDLLESVEPALHCILCGNVRSIGWVDGQVTCISCRNKLKDDRICERHERGQHIPIFCDRCGAAHSTKNIGSIGARSIFALHDGCSCQGGWYFHDCEGRLFVKGSFETDKFVQWRDEYEEGRKK